LEPREAVQQHDLFTRRARKLPPAPEFAIHVMVADLLDRWASPGWRWTHIASGELRNIATAARLKRMGVKPGWPDFILLHPKGWPHFLELKRRGGKLSAAQDDFRAWCAVNQTPFACVDSFDKALATLKGWGALRMMVRA
jgi:hypothetical protein